MIYRRFFAIAGFVFLFVSVFQGATIITKTGETIEGVIQGTVVMKSHVWKLSTEFGTYGVVYYAVVEGSNVKSMDKEKTIFNPNTQVYFVLLDWEADKVKKQPTDLEVVEFAKGKHQMGIDFKFFGECSAMGLGLSATKESDTSSIFWEVSCLFSSGTSKAILVKPTFDKIIGVYEKTEQGPGKILNEIIVKTKEGDRSLKLSEIQ